MAVCGGYESNKQRQGLNPWATCLYNIVFDQFIASLQLYNPWIFEIQYNYSFYNFATLKEQPHNTSRKVVMYNILAV